MPRRKSFKGWFYPAFCVIGFVSVIILMIYLPDIYPTEEWATMRSNFILLMPWLIMIGFGFFALVYITRDKPKFLYAYTVPTGAIIGVGSAMTLRTLYDLGIIIDEITSIHSSITVTDLQLITILVWTMMGLVVGVLND